MNIHVMDVKKGDIIRFKSYALRVEHEPVIGNGSIRIEGRISIDGSPTVRKQFMAGRMVNVDRLAV